MFQSKTGGRVAVHPPHPPDSLRSTGPTASLPLAPALRVTAPLRLRGRSIRPTPEALSACQTGQHALQGRPGAISSQPEALAGRAHGLDGRPESVTSNWSRLRSSTALRVAVHDGPCLNCPVMRAPTSSAGSQDRTYVQVERRRRPVDFHFCGRIGRVTGSAWAGAVLAVVRRSCEGRYR